jgi:hypothetical protein
MGNGPIISRNIRNEDNISGVVGKDPVRIYIIKTMGL